MILIGLAVGLIAYLICSRLFGDRIAGTLACLIVTFHPVFLWGSGRIMTDTFALFLFGVSVYLFLRDLQSPSYGCLVLLAIIAALTTLVRPIYAFSAVVYLTSIIYINRKNLTFGMKKSVVLLLAFVLTLSPWFSYTYSKLGKPVLSVLAGVNFYIGNNPDSNGRHVWTKRMSRELPLEWDELKRNSEGLKKGLNFIRKHPWRALLLYIRKVLIMIFAPSPSPNYLVHHRNPLEGKPPTFMILLLFSGLMNISYILVEVVGIRGLLNGQIRDYQKRTLTVILLFSYIIPAIFFTSIRYTFPIIFVSIVPGSLYISSIVGKNAQVSTGK